MIEFAETPEGLKVAIDGAHFTTYVHNTGLPKVILYPLLTPQGRNVVRPLHPAPGEKPDHPHHRGLWCAHGDVDGIDFWEEYKPEHGRIVHQEMVRIDSSCGILQTLLLWADATGRPVLHERRSMLFEKVDQAFAVAISTALTSATGDAVTFGDTKEGGLTALRVAPTMVAAGAGRITNANGQSCGPMAKGAEPTWGKRAKWVSYSGPTADGATATASILHLPESFAYPTYWHVRGYGLFAANPFAKSFFENELPGKERDPAKSGEVVLPPGEALRWQSVVLASDGAVTPQQADAWHTQWSAKLAGRLEL